jgi:drug/metabolite transporter (DMT)-like permease
MLPLSLAMVLFWTQPISAIILSRIFMGETLSNMQVFSVGAAMFGVVLLTNPQLFTGGDSLIEFEKYPHFEVGVCLSLLGSLTTGAAYMMIRKMGTDVHSYLSPMYFGVFSTITVHVLMQAIGDPLNEPYSAYGLFLLFLIGICMLFGQIFVSKSMQIEKAGRAAPINYL